MKVTNKGGRPSLGERKKKFQIKISLTEDEYTTLKNKSGEFSVPLFELTRSFVVNGSVHVIEKYNPTEKLAIASLVNIGNNLNQISKNLNIKNDPKVEDIKWIYDTFLGIYEKLKR